ncbi:MAG: T9SS type A sorting domain-containing protein, partial [Bacteroidota bacterium]|nr:T9SS type A sorting domain-containing protein [Bacteroidota bacterium]
HLVWSSVPNAVSYAVRLAKADFTPPRYSTVMDTTLDVSDLTPNSTYYIQVEANMANDATDWSYNGYYFLTEPSANVPFVSTRDQLFVYPNPASDEVHISLGEDPAALRVRIIDLLGHVLHAPITAETGGFAIDVHALPFGVYEVVVSGKDTRTFRFVVEH